MSGASGGLPASSTTFLSLIIVGRWQTERWTAVSGGRTALWTDSVSAVSPVARHRLWAVFK